MANEKKIEDLRKLYSEVQQANTKFGLDNFGTPAHKKVEEALAVIREEFQKLKPKEENVSTDSDPRN